MISVREYTAMKVGLVPAVLVALGLALGGCQKKEAQPEKSDARSESADHEKKESGEKVDGDGSKGVGPIHAVEIGALDEALAAKGEKVFSGTCSACHKMEARYVGPALAGVTKRRKPEWIMNMIMNPAEMTQKDPTAKALLGEYMTQMSVIATEAEARSILEYFRKSDGK
jgi:hypothetical protein